MWLVKLSVSAGKLLRGAFDKGLEYMLSGNGGRPHLNRTNVFKAAAVVDCARPFGSDLMSTLAFKFCCLVRQLTHL